MGCKEGALKPSLQLFITSDQKVCSMQELRFPIPNLLLEPGFRVILLLEPGFRVPKKGWPKRFSPFLVHVSAVPLSYELESFFEGQVVRSLRLFRVSA